MNILAERWFIWQSQGGYGYSNIAKDAEIRQWHVRFEQLKEYLQKRNGDLYCLQEVDEAVFTNDLLPFFRSLDFDGAFQSTKNEYPIATAMFWRRSLMSQEWIDNRSRTMLSQFNMINSRKQFYVVCCHLEGNKPPDGYKGEQRVNQMQSSLKQVEKHMRANKLDVEATSLIVAGDLNACPMEELHELLRTGVLNAGFKFQLEVDAVCGEGDIVVAKGASQPFKLRSAALVANGCEPALTFIGNNASYTLDYVYVSKSVTVLSVIDPSLAFTKSEVRAMHGAVPSAVLPSDHLPLVADLLIE